MGNNLPLLSAIDPLTDATDPVGLVLVKSHMSNCSSIYNLFYTYNFLETKKNAQELFSSPPREKLPKDKRISKFAHN